MHHREAAPSHFKSGRRRVDPSSHPLKGIPKRRTVEITIPENRADLALEFLENTRRSGSRDIAQVKEPRAITAIGDIHHGAQVVGMIVRIGNDGNQHDGLILEPS